MPVLKPFKGIRPNKDKVAQVAVRPFEVLYSPESRGIISSNPYSFLHVIEPAEGNPENTPVNICIKAKDNFNQFVEDGILTQDERPCLYVYQAIRNGERHTGIWACTAIDDYLNNTLKKHELTRSEREKDLIDYLQLTAIDANPVLITYRPVKSIDDLIAAITASEPEYDFISEEEENTRHKLWVVKDEKNIAQMIDHFAALPCSYIADGHHRAAAAATLGVENRKMNLKHNGKEEYNFFTSIYFPSNQLHIYEFNRLIKDINGFTAEEFIDRIADNFIVSKVNADVHKPTGLHNFGMYIENQWYSLTAKPVTYSDDNPVSKIDVSILHDFLLDPILYIKDPRTDQRIDFVGGIKDISTLIDRVNSGEMKVAFTLYPTSIEQLMEVADSGNVMPPKSTWFEPKLHVGLVVHQID